MKLLLFFMSIHAHAAPAPFLWNEIPCSTHVQKIFKASEEPVEWKTHAQDFGGEKIFRSRTHKVGIWFEMVVAGSTVVVEKFTPQNTQSILFGPECKRSVRLSPPISGLATQDTFTDRDLEKWLLQNKKNKAPGLIYLWSPHMGLSIQGLREVTHIAREKKMDLLLLMDPDVTEKALKPLKKNRSLPVSAFKKFRSTELSMRSAFEHFPSYHLVKNGEFVGPPRLGLDEPEQFKRWTEKVLK